MMPETISKEVAEWVTCSPMNFWGCDTYVNRDAGLVGEGFRVKGWSCRSILLAPSMEADLPFIIRASRCEMEDPKWWAGVARRGVVFYNSAKPLHAPVLLAAKSAGLPIAMNVDNSCIFDFHNMPGEFWRKSMMHKSDLAAPKRLVSASAGVLKSYHQRLNGSYRRFAAHLAIADVIGAVTPDAQDRLRSFLMNHGQASAVGRVHLIPHPAHPRFVTSGEKPNDGSITFVTVGRWDVQRQKRPDLLMGVIDSLLARDQRFRFRIYGKLTPELQRWHAGLASTEKNRVGLHGIVPNAELLEAYQTAHIYLCVSAYESFLIAAAEAMCCGCSIVATDLPTLPGPRWFASGLRGSLATKHNIHGLVSSSLIEAEAWLQGKRNGHEIAAWTQQNMHANHVANSYLKLLSCKTQNSQPY